MIFPVRQATTTKKKLSPANNQASVIQSGTRNLPHSTYAEFSKHVCLQWLNPLGYYGTKSPPDPPKNRPLKALFMSGLWGESNRPKDSVDRGFSTCYHWATYQRIPLGRDWINPPPRLINWNQWMGCQEEEKGGGGGGEEKVEPCQMKGGIGGCPETRGHLQDTSLHTLRKISQASLVHTWH